MAQIKIMGSGRFWAIVLSSLLGSSAANLTAQNAAPVTPAQASAAAQAPPRFQPTPEMLAMMAATWVQLHYTAPLAGIVMVVLLECTRQLKGWRWRGRPRAGLASLLRARRASRGSRRCRPAG